jgi:diguanylate cyclase (GGDEF)-like protein
MAVHTSERRVRSVIRPEPQPGPLRRLNPVTLAWLLVAIELTLGVAAILAPLRVVDVFTFVMAGLAVAAMVVGIRWHRPAPAIGWWLLVASVVVNLAAIATVVSAKTATNPVPRPSPAAGVLFGMMYLLLVFALAWIGRSTGSRSGTADLIDALIVAAAAFPVLWSLVIDPLFDVAGFSGPATIVAPVACLLIVVMSVKLFFSIGVHTWPAVWLVIAIGALLATNIGVLMPAVSSGTGLPSAFVPYLWVVYPVALGIAMLHPAVASFTDAPPRPDTQLSVRRVVMLGALALVVPVGFILEDVFLRHDHLRNIADAVAMVLPVVAVAMLLVARLATVARLAQGRAAELARQAHALDVSAREQETLRQQLTYRALHDPLTGLANRVVLSERLEWALTRRGGTGQHALLLLDLDGFKDINDTLGHQVGDEVLITAAHRVLALVPEGGMLARLGGDELAALLEEVDRGQAVDWAERVLQAIRRPFEVAGRQLYLTTSIGVSMLDIADGQPTTSNALRDADLALYAAKGAGKDRATVFEPEMVEARLTHSLLSAGLRRALLHDEFRVHYQPVVDLTTGQVRAVEALLRWTTAGGQQVPPAEFIPVAEETGLINEIGAWVLRRACAQARSWYATRGVAVSVNVSGRQLVDPGFSRVVLDALAAAGLPGEALIIEVTETSLVATATVSTAEQQLNQLRDEGVRVAIDDFGTGYSSLSYLARLPVDILKIDSSFTRSGKRIAFGPEDWPFAKAIMELGDGLSLTTVAEGIETTEQADALRQLNCQLAQGYLFSRPVPPEAIDDLLSMPGAAAAGAPPGAAPAGEARSPVDRATV